MKTQNPLQVTSDEVQTLSAPVRIKYCLYARKSSEADELQALSIDSQIKEMLELAKRENLDVVEIRKESHSAKASGTRPVFIQLLEDIRKGQFNGILTWAPDRLSRNGGDLGAVVDLMDQNLLTEIRTYSQKFTNSPNEKFLLMILGSQAKLENDNKGVNVKRGLKTRAEMGLWPSVAPTGYANEKIVGRECYVMVDPIRGPIVKQIFEKVAYEKWSGRKIHKWLIDINFKTKNNKNLNLSTIYNILKTPFYTGTFEYPRGSGNWYKGQHTPLITQEVFNLVQEKLNEDNKPKTKFKEFTFVKLMTCGKCGSGITAQEKTKNISDGSIHTYIYYSCTRHKDHNCKNPYIREDQLLIQLEEIIEKLDINRLGARHIIDREIERHNKLRSNVLGITGEKKLKEQEIDIRAYAKYLLKEGTVQEKRELLEQLRNKILVNDKKISIE
jgi:DNA invertase Pin-like site-specific DNA recombinase/predicted metal-binding protein